MLLFKGSYRHGRSCHGHSPALTKLHFCILSMLDSTPRAQSTTPLHCFDAGVIPITNTQMQQLKAHETKWLSGLKSYKQCSFLSPNVPLWKAEGLGNVAIFSRLITGHQCPLQGVKNQPWGKKGSPKDWWNPQEKEHFCLYLNPKGFLLLLKSGYPYWCWEMKSDWSLRPRKRLWKLPERMWKQAGCAWGRAGGTGRDRYFLSAAWIPSSGTSDHEGDTETSGRGLVFSATPLCALFTCRGAVSSHWKCSQRNCGFCVQKSLERVVLSGQIHFYLCSLLCVVLNGTGSLVL